MNMYLKKAKSTKTGRTHLSIAHNYRDEKGKNRTRTIQSLGYLDVLEKEHSDPIAHFNALVAEMEAERVVSEGKITFTKSKAKKISIKESTRKNLGYLALSAIYHELGLARLMLNRQRKHSFEYSADKALQLGVFSRVLDPASKRHDILSQKGYFESFKLSKDDYYGSLSFLATQKDACLTLMDSHMRTHYGRAGDLSYYDVTNYYFEIDDEDEFRRLGISKEHRPDPLVQMGLFLDAQGFPVTYNLHPGNTHDSDTLIGELSRYKRDFSSERIIVVADKGINCSENIIALAAKKDGYIFSSSVRGASKEVVSWVTSTEGWSDYTGEGAFNGEKGYRQKSRIFERTLYNKTDDGKRKKGPKITEKQVAFYSPKYDRRAKKEREHALAKARELIKSPGKLKAMFDRSAARYVKGIAYDDNGEVIDTNTTLLFDEAKLEREEALDGYYIISTSEVEMADSNIIAAYRGLWKIEESFRVIKSLLEGRPVYLTRKDRIEAHFLICFITLLITRILEHKTDYAHSSKAIASTLKKASGTHLSDNWWIFDHRDDCLDAIGAALGLDFTKEILSTGDIRKMSGIAKGTGKSAKT